MNWRKLLVLYTASVLDEVGMRAEGEFLRMVARNVPIMDSGGVVILPSSVASTRICQAIPETLDEATTGERMRYAAFLVPLLLERRIVETVITRVRPPAWAAPEKQ